MTEAKARDQLIEAIFRIIHKQLDIDDVESQLGYAIFDTDIDKFVAVIKGS